MKLYRLYTENKNLESLKAMFDDFTMDFTFYVADGYYLGIPESSVIFEVISRMDLRENFRYMARQIKTMNKQKSVLLTVQDIEAEFV